MSEVRFDHRDPEVEALMQERAARQGVESGSSLARDQGLEVDAEPRVPVRRATDDVAEMRRRTREHEDPLGVDDPPEESDEEELVVGLATGGTFTISGTLGATQSWVAGQALVDAVALLAARLKSGAEVAADVMAAFNVLSAEDRARIVAAITEADEQARGEQRRHGHASVCPRHGPTRGGLCRRCNR